MEEHLDRELAPNRLHLRRPLDRMPASFLLSSSYLDDRPLLPPPSRHSALLRMVQGRPSKSYPQIVQV
ncbi:unnamed protein product [Parascedosporium putredinis]|uniref:Uncharacterized protein n=1 Tax=Parascedosporium putredinis TaxID=1442378 RepID=A0A9P1GWN6_9PEZI|nr:unnamed protein product [Parascedosporium putredinis]CAI7989711.1 unnamed protein product [Parascedosporium putredinis]